MKQWMCLFPLFCDSIRKLNGLLAYSQRVRGVPLHTVNYQTILHEVIHSLMVSVYFDASAGLFVSTIRCWICIRDAVPLCNFLYNWCYRTRHTDTIREYQTPRKLIWHLSKCGKRLPWSNPSLNPWDRLTSWINSRSLQTFENICMLHWW